MYRDYRLAVNAADAAVPRILARQALDRRSPDYGGFITERYGFASACHVGAGADLSTLVAAYACPDSENHLDQDLGRRLDLALRFMLRKQNRDGTIDLEETNHNSSPDTGFVIQGMCPIYELLMKTGKRRAKEMAGLTERFIRKAMKGMCRGGFHTPNHRWVIASALSHANTLFPSPEAVRVIEDYLAEGIDCNPDGQFTERSTGVYNSVNDRSLITVAEKFNRPDLLPHVRRNLDMMYHMMHGDGTLVTAFSGRQDRGTRVDMGRYYGLYKTMAVKDRNGVYASLADFIVERLMIPKGAAPPLTLFLERPELISERVRRRPLPAKYEKHFRRSGVARIRDGALSASLSVGASCFFTLKWGTLELHGMKVASTFFGRGQFRGETLKRIGRGYVMSQTVSGDYRLPLSPEDRVPSGDWAAMDHAKRRRVNTLTLTTTATVTRVEGGFDIRVQADGYPGVPLQIELWFEGGGRLSAEGVFYDKAPEGPFILRKGVATYQVGDFGVTFGPGEMRHTMTAPRGSEPKGPGVSACINDRTPVDRVVKIRLRRY